MATKTQPESAVATFLAGRWEEGAKKMAALVEALPEDRLEWTAASGARSYGGVLRHVAFWNRYIADSLRGKAADDSSNELPAAEYATKVKVLAAVEETSREVVAALRERPKSADQNTLELAVAFLEHNAEHYGQLAVYARLLGIVPPSSRG